MKTLTVAVVAVVFGLMLTGPVFAQPKDMGNDLATAMNKGATGVYKGVAVVSCNGDLGTCLVNTPNKGQITAIFTYGQYNGRFDAAKQLKPGDKITGQFTELDGKYYATSIIKE